MCELCAKILLIKLMVTFLLTQLSIQLALSGFAEFTLHLTRLGPEMLQIAQDSGRLTVSYSRFEVDDSKGNGFLYLNIITGGNFWENENEYLILMLALLHPR